MKCQSCGKKEATVRYMEDINGKKQEMHFCIESAITRKLFVFNQIEMICQFYLNIAFKDFQTLISI